MYFCRPHRRYRVHYTEKLSAGCIINAVMLVTEAELERLKTDKNVKIISIEAYEEHN